MSTSAKSNEYSEYKPSYEQLAELLEAVRFMGVEKNLNKLLPYMAKHCLNAIGADRCSIFLLDENTNEIWSRYVGGEIDEIRIPKGSGIAGQCIETGQPIVIEDPYNNPHFNREVDQTTGYQTRNLLCVPLYNLADEVIGCFQVINKHEDEDFTRGDQAVLAAFGAQAAVAIESAILVEEKEAIISALTAAEERMREAIVQLRAIYELEKFASDYSPDIKGLSHVALNKTLEAIDGEISAVCLIHSDGSRHFYGFSDSFGLKHKALDLESDLNSSYVAGLDDLVKSSFETPINSVLHKPLVVSDVSGSQNIIGSIAIFNHSSGDFSDRDREFLEMISRQINAVYEKQKLIQQKKDSDRLSMVGKLLATVVHDLKNPLSNISGIAQLLERSGDMEAEEAQSFLKIISREVSRCSSMLQELLDFSSGRSRVRLDDVNIEDFFASASSSLKAQAEIKGIVLEVENKVDGPFKIDADRMMRVIFNIANNSFEVLEEGGVFKIHCCLDEMGSLLITLSDNGPGIPLEIRDNIFKAFVTFGKSKGTGLGMHIAREIVTAHGGKIELDPAKGNGATFRITIPAKS